MKSDRKRLKYKVCEIDDVPPRRSFVPQRRGLRPCVWVIMHLMKVAGDGWNIRQTEENQNKKKLEQQQNKHLRFFAGRFIIHNQRRTGTASASKSAERASLNVFPIKEPFIHGRDSSPPTAAVIMYKRNRSWSGWSNSRVVVSRRIASSAQFLHSTLASGWVVYR